MVEIIHRFKENYPFGINKEHDQTFVEVIRSNLTEQEIKCYRLKNKIYREIDNNKFIKLIRVLKQDNALHFLFEYFEVSLEIFVNELTKQKHGVLDQNEYLELIHCFQTNLNQIFQRLIQFAIKCDLLINNLAVERQENLSFSIKAFIDVDAECLTLRKEQTCDQITNQEELVEYYEAEKKRLLVEFEELIENKFEKIERSREQKNMPNFIINGTKLVFLKEQSQDEKDKSKHLSKNSCKESRKNDNSSNVTSQKQEEIKPTELIKLSSKINQIISQSKKNLEKITNFDQSFDPVFKPEEIVKEKTYILEESAYLMSLDEEIHALIEEQIKQIQDNKSNQQITKYKQDLIKEIKNKEHHSLPYKSLDLHRENASDLMNILSHKSHDYHEEIEQRQLLHKKQQNLIHKTDLFDKSTKQTTESSPKMKQSYVNKQKNEKLIAKDQENIEKRTNNVEERKPKELLEENEERNEKMYKWNKIKEAKERLENILRQYKKQQ